MHRRIIAQLIMALVIGVVQGGCIAGPVEESVAPTEKEQTIDNATPLPPTPTQLPPTHTETPITPTATSTETLSPTLTNTPTQTQIPTETSPPPTPSGDNAVYVFYIQKDTGGPVSCGDSLVALNTGIYRTGNITVDVKAALKRLFVKVQYFGALYNPSYLSNINVDRVEYKKGKKLVLVYLVGTYVRSEDPCDSSRVRGQVWTTIRQFPEVEEVYILLNQNLLGDILAGK